MKAVVIDRPGNASVLVLREVPEPELAPDCVRVRVRATALNRADLLQRKGLYPAPPGVPANIPGLEFVGEIAALGAAVTGWKVGQRVMGLVGGGSYAEFVVTHERLLLAVPEHLSDPEAAAIPEAFLTAHDALVQGNMAAGSHVLIHAVGSGVGIAAVQLVQALRGTSYGTSRSAHKLARAAEYGLKHGLADHDFAEALAGLRPAGLELVVDLVGGATTARSLGVLGSKGHLVLVGLVAGASAELDLGTVLRKRLRITGTVLRSRPLEEKAGTARAVETQVLPGFHDGSLTVPIERTFPLEQVHEAYEHFAAGGKLGKVVLTTS